MKRFFYSSFIAIIIFSLIDFTIGNKIINYFYKSGLIMLDVDKLESINNEEKKYRVSNKFYHHTLKKNIKNTSTWGKEKYLTCTDEFGFRKHCNSKKNRNKNIILIGDSFTEGIGLNYEKTFAGMFSKKNNYNVYNMGVTSYSPVIYKNKVIHHINKGLKIDHVIVFIDISDIDDEANNYIECNNKVCTNSKLILSNRKNIQKKEIKIFPLLDLIKLNFKKIKRIFKPKIYIYRKDFKRSNWTFIPENKEINLGIQNSINHMNALYKYLNDKKISLSVAVYPHPGQILHDKKNSKQVKIWENFCEKKCRYFINYFPTFFNELHDIKPKKLIKKYYIKNDIHFNYQGNLILFNKLGSLAF